MVIKPVNTKAAIKNNLLLYLLIYSLFCASCNRAEKISSFCCTDTEKGWIRPIEHTIEIGDSTSIRALNICLQMKYLLNSERYCEIPFVLNIVSPSGSCYADTVNLPIDIIESKNNINIQNGIITMQWPYRKNIINRDKGEWKFIFIPQNSNNNLALFSKITGIGISCKSDNENEFKK